MSQTMSLRASSAATPRRCISPCTPWSRSCAAAYWGTPRGARLPGQLKKLAEGGIGFHAQAVLCPGLNDGAALEDTIGKLAAMHPAARSLALVPVGLTDHREGLCALHKYTPEEARGVLDIAGRWRERLLKKLGTRFVFPSDEFYLAAGRPLPEDGEYEDYEQIDDGVGMLRLLETEVFRGIRRSAGAAEKERRGQDAAGRLRRIRGAVSAADVRFPSAHGPDGGRPGAGKTAFSALPSPSAACSPAATSCAACKARRARRVLISECMLRDGEQVFLDDMTLEEVSRALEKPVIPVGRRGDEVLSAILEASTWQGRW